MLHLELAPAGLGLFLRIPVVPRVKTEDSLVQKAFIRKRYADPYNDIEDKVGVRFVVLLNEDVRLIGNAIENAAAYWTWDKARDFESERQANPSVFDYQSLHYVVRSKPGIRHDDLDLPADLPCEIQVRTLLQHAYSELTHDTIYKPSVSTTPEMMRAAAKSMALIEATDDYFSEVVEIIRNKERSALEIEADLMVEYRALTGLEPVRSPLNTQLIDYYKKFAGPNFSADLREWLAKKPYVKERLVQHDPSDFIFDVPAILLVLFAISEHPENAKVESPLSDEELESLYSLFGYGLHG
nr:RelA/SpoT domain-containing protein [Rhizobium laguerreae]